MKKPAAPTYRFEALGDGRFAISGTFGFPTVTSILERSKQLFESVPVITVDLAGVTHADSAGLALLLEWINWALHYQREIRFSAIPGQLLDMARISDVDKLLQSGDGAARAQKASAPATA